MPTNDGTRLTSLCTQVCPHMHAHRPSAAQSCHWPALPTPAPAGGTTRLLAPLSFTDRIKLESPRLRSGSSPAHHCRHRGPKLLRQQSCLQGQGTEDTATVAIGGRFTDTEGSAGPLGRALAIPMGQRVAPPGQTAPEHGAAIIYHDVPLTVSPLSANSPSKTVGC